VTPNGLSSFSRISVSSVGLKTLPVAMHRLLNSSNTAFNSNTVFNSHKLCIRRCRLLMVSSTDNNGSLCRASRLILLLQLVHIFCGRLGADGEKAILLNDVLHREHV
jgi:hypothetical protein